MNFIDIILGGLIIFGIVRGFSKGFFLEIAALAALILGIYGAIHFSYLVGDYLQSQLEWDIRFIKLTAFLITFFIIIIAVNMAGKFLTKMADLAALGIFNRVMGGLFGGLKIAVILGAVLIFFDRTNNTIGFIDKETTDKSVLYLPVRNLGALVFYYVLKERQEYQEEKQKVNSQQQII